MKAAELLTKFHSVIAAGFTYRNIYCFEGVGGGGGSGG